MISTDFAQRPAAAPVRNQPPVRTHAAEGGVELREIVHILARRRIAIVAALVLGLIVAGFSSLLAKRRYSATATLEVNRESGSSLGFADLSGIAGGLGDQEGMNMDLLTQQAVIQSDNTALRVVEDLKLDEHAPYAAAFKSSGAADREAGLPLEHAPLRREHALKAFRSGLRVNLIKGTRLLTVTFTDPDPDRAAAIANAIVDVYSSESTQARFQASSKTSLWLAGQLADLKHRVEQSQAKVDVFERTSGLTGVATGVSEGRGKTGAADDIALTRLIELNRDLTNAEAARIAREAVYRMTETHDPEVVLGAGSSALAGELGPGSPLAPDSGDLALLAQLRRQLAQVEVDEAAAGTKYGAKNPAMVQLKNEEVLLSAQMRAELERIRTRAKNELDVAILEEDGLHRQIARQEQVVNTAAAKADELILLQEEAQSSRQIYQDLYTKLEEASVTAGIKASNIVLVDPARAPAQPSYPKKRVMLALGAFAGLALGLASALAWDYFDDSLAVPEDLAQITSVAVIGTIPDFCQRKSSVAYYGRRGKSAEADGAESQTWLLRAPHSQTAEAYRALRTALQLSRAEHAPRVVMFMSGSAEEGKSTTCMNTAAAFAVQGDRVLYLDADLRRAKGHRLFGCENDAGLSSCLANGLEFSAALKPHREIETLFLLPAGDAAPNPSELLGSKRFNELLGELRRHFDYIFIDSPPVLVVTDAQVIAPQTDGCVFVVRANRTLKRLLGRSLALIESTDAPVLGVVMNAFRPQPGTSSAYGYAKKGGRYYAEACE